MLYSMHREWSCHVVIRENFEPLEFCVPSETASVFPHDLRHRFRCTGALHAVSNALNYYDCTEKLSLCFRCHRLYSVIPDTAQKRLDFPQLMCVTLLGLLQGT